ncbi:MAG: hypothetical protein IPL22_22150 [Bacteroidetes bacterium]|nr:hypothetical protein [Bacteroidota bacterium]
MESIVNRDYFPGKQADWQYNNFRFEIKENDTIYFYVTDKEIIIKTYRAITTTKPYSSERLIINMEQPTHHILTNNNNLSKYMEFLFSFLFAENLTMFISKGEMETTR